MSERFVSRRRQLANLAPAVRSALLVYGLQDARVSLLKHFCNTTYRVVMEDGRRFALHLFRYFDHSIASEDRGQWIESELWWLLYLRKQGVIVPKVVIAPRGQNVTFVQDRAGATIPIVLFEWVDGRRYGPGLTPNHLRLIGEMTARLHLLSSGLTVPAEFLRGQIDRVDSEARAKLVESLHLHSPEAGALARRSLDFLSEAIDNVGRGSDAFGLIHADIHHTNALFRNGQVTLIDFGDCGWGHYLYDLGVTCSALRRWRRNSELRAAFLGGYETMRALPSGSDRLIACFEALRDMQDLAASVVDRPDPVVVPDADGIDDGLKRLDRKVARLAGDHANKGTSTVAGPLTAR